MSESALKRAVTGHFMRYWGPPRAIRVREGAALELAVMEFPPRPAVALRKERKSYRFATNGMSSWVQSVRGHRYRMEVYLSSRDSEPWIVELLASLAEYPLQEETNLGEFGTVPLANPIVRGRRPFTALLISPPGPWEDETIGAILGVTPEPIVVHQAVAISSPELDFAIEHGSEALWRRLLGLANPLLIDEPRPDAVPPSR